MQAYTYSTMVGVGITGTRIEPKVQSIPTTFNHFPITIGLTFVIIEPKVQPIPTISNHFPITIIPTFLRFHLSQVCKWQADGEPEAIDILVTLLVESVGNETDNVDATMEETTGRFAKAGAFVGAVRLIHLRPFLMSVSTET